MPTLEEIRDLLQKGGFIEEGEIANGALEIANDALVLVDLHRPRGARPKSAVKIDSAENSCQPKHIPVKKTSGRYAISVSGEDAILKFGKHKGRKLTKIVEKNGKYLLWLLQQPFPDDLKDVCRYVLNKDRNKR